MTTDLKHQTETDGPPAWLEWERIHASEGPQSAGLIPTVMRGGLDGLTVLDVMSTDEVSRAVDYLEDHGLHGIPLNFGSMLGMPLSGARGTDRSNFLADTRVARIHYREAFGFDPHERLCEVLAPMLGDLRPGWISEGEEVYNPGNLRWWQPGRGGLPAHAGNEFAEIHRTGAMSHLLTTTIAENHLSYFIVLQTPTTGGSLRLYDLRASSYPRHDDPWGEATRDDSWFDQVTSTEIDLPTGSLVVFGGGGRWHRVDPVHGPRARITYGGFAGPSADGRELHFWC